MRLLASLSVLFLSVALCLNAWGSSYPRVEADLKVYETHVAELKAAFAKLPADPSSKDWVKAKLAHMYEIDQYMRFTAHESFARDYSAEERAEFVARFFVHFKEVDEANTSDLKELLKRYHWFTISDFGEVAESQAWLLVQHADLDPDFQKDVLDRLAELVPLKETRASNYAYLFDRVAASWNDLSKRTLQRYGSQGACTEEKVWAPIPVEDPANLDTRRATVGLEPEQDYIDFMTREFCSKSL